jgi:alpha-ribazole phosphatase
MAAVKIIDVFLRRILRLAAQKTAKLKIYAVGFGRPRFYYADLPPREGAVSLSNNESQKIYFVRHAKPELPHGGKLFYGSTDYPLSSEGIKRAGELAEDLKGIRFDHIFSSDMQRALHTAELIVPHRKGEIAQVPALREIDLGEWEGRSFDEVREEWDEIYEARGKSFDSVAPPAGESFIELQARTVPAFEDILAKCPSGDILLVAHGGVIWTLMCHYFGLKLNDLFFFPMDYCGLHLICRTGGLMRLLRYNWNSRLSDVRL